MPAVRDSVKSGYAALLDRTGALDGWLRLRPGRTHPVILNYHLLTRERFADHMQALLRRFRVISLDDCVHHLESGANVPENSVVVTFDDAYRQFHDQIEPIVRSLDIPVAMFIPTGSVDAGQPLWFNRVKAWVMACREPMVAVGRAWVCLTGDRRMAYHAIVARLNMMPESQRAEWMQNHVAAGPFDEGVLSRYAPMSWDQIRRLSPRVSLGAHTVSHPSLRQLDEASVARELAESRQRIEHETSEPVEFLAYPFGRPTNVSAKTESAARQGGFRAALTTNRGACRSGADLFRLPRLVCDGVSSGAILAAQLSSLWVHLSR